MIEAMCMPRSIPRFVRKAFAGFATSATVVAAILFPALLCAQGAANYPWKPVTIVMPYTPGSTSDLEARVYQENLTDVLRQSVLIDYKPGGSGIIANNHVVKAAPDGHTIVFNPATIAILPAVRGDIPYDFLRDLTPVVLTTRRVFVLAVTPSFPANTFQEYIAHARANPGKVTWSTAGAGGALHMSGEWLASGAGVKITFVHYKGTSLAEPDLIAGRVDSAAKSLVTVLPLIKAGKVRVLAIVTGERSSLLPGVRTVAEMGIPGYDYPSWIGFMTTGATPRDIVEKLHAGFVKAIHTPKAMKVWESQGTVPVGLGPDEYRKQLVTETALWRKLVRENNIKYDE